MIWLDASLWQGRSIICGDAGRKEMFYLTTHSTHFIYVYMASDIWLRTILIVRMETCCRHIGYSYRLTATVLLYAPSHRQDNTYHSLCYTSCGAKGKGLWFNDRLNTSLWQGRPVICSEAGRYQVQVSVPAPNKNMFTKYLQF